jgi:protein phosphatase
MRLDIAALSDMGRRKRENEDSFGVFRDDTPNLDLFRDGALVAVADGLGGHMGGEIASKLAVSILRDSLKEPPPQPTPDGDTDGPTLDLMTRYVRLANSSVYKTNQDLNPNGKPMGTTLTACLISPKKAYVCNVGDSRVYHIRDGDIIGRTEDHSWVDEQVKAGLMSKSEAELDFRRNVVTRSVGTRPDIEIDSYVWHVVAGDWLLLCSDGLVNMVKDAEICAEFRRGGSAAEIVHRLVNMANENGGKDNITVVAASISPSPFLLLYVRLRSIKRKHGFKLMWFLVSALLGLVGFLAGYIYRSQGHVLPLLGP